MDAISMQYIHIVALSCSCPCPVSDLGPQASWMEHRWGASELLCQSDMYNCCFTSTSPSQSSVKVFYCWQPNFSRIGISLETKLLITNRTIALLTSSSGTSMMSNPTAPVPLLYFQHEIASIAWFPPQMLGQFMTMQETAPCPPLTCTFHPPSANALCVHSFYIRIGIWFYLIWAGTACTRLSLYLAWQGRPKLLHLSILTISSVKGLISTTARYADMRV